MAFQVQDTTAINSPSGQVLSATNAWVEQLPTPGSDSCSVGTTHITEESGFHNWRGLGDCDSSRTLRQPETPQDSFQNVPQLL